MDNINLRIEQFEKFYNLLMSNAPKDYIPWFFPCKKNGKDPCPEAILNINPTSKGSWHHFSARLSKEQCIEHIKMGYNIGISVRENDPLIIGDIDNKDYLSQLPKDTLTVTSRKRIGAHFFGWNKDGTAKINLPTDDGEIRSNNQYVLACGSYVSFNLNEKKDKEAYDELDEAIKIDKLLGYYTIRNGQSPRVLCFKDFPDFFKNKEKNNIETETKILQKEETTCYPKDGKYTELFNLKVSDIVGLIPSNKREGHPLHDSDTDSNFSLSSDGYIAHCWRHTVSLNAVQYLCVKAGYASCEDAGTPHKGRGISKIRGDSKAYEAAYQEAIKCGLIKEKANKVFTKKGQVNAFIEKQPIFFDKAGLWWLWNSNSFCWERVDEVDILNFIGDKDGSDIISSKSRNEILNGLKQEGRKNIPKSVKSTWIQFKKEIIDINTGEIFEATPEYFITNPIPWELHPDKFINTPTIDKIFEE